VTVTSPERDLAGSAALDRSPVSVRSCVPPAGLPSPVPVGGALAIQWVAVRGASTTTDVRVERLPDRHRAGRLAEARTTLERLRHEGFPIRPIYPWSVGVTDLAEAAEVAGVAEVAAHVLTVAAPFGGRIAVSGPNPNRTFDQALAQAALATGDIPAAEAHARRAVIASRQQSTPVFLVRELVFLAEARRRGGASAEEVRRPLVHQAVAMAETIGAGAAIADVERYSLPT
jgi:hypothetical protein